MLRDGLGAVARPPRLLDIAQIAAASMPLAPGEQTGR
jgi:hypothetical protein